MSCHIFVLLQAPILKEMKGKDFHQPALIPFQRLQPYSTLKAHKL